MSDKLERLVSANELLETVKSCGRKFFENKHGYDTRLEINDKGNIYYIDDYTGSRICIRGDCIRSRGFSHGGGLNSFIRILANYVRGKTHFNAEYLGCNWG